MNKRTLLAAVFAALVSLPLAVTAAEEKKKGASFASMDKNKDGKVSKAEYMEANKDNPKAGDRFAALDKDGDGHLTEEEFKAGQKKKKDK
jgi:Ca2+-binding EF-hand superfamily protein